MNTKTTITLSTTVLAAVVLLFVSARATQAHAFWGDWGWHHPWVGWHHPWVGWHHPWVGWHHPWWGWHSEGWDDPW